MFTLGKSKPVEPHEPGSKIRLRCNNKQCCYEWQYCGVSMYKATCPRCGKTCNLKRCQVKEVPKDGLAELINALNTNYENWSVAIANSTEETRNLGVKLFRRLMEECSE
jgi:hypothetical protein